MSTESPSCAPEAVLHCMLADRSQMKKKERTWSPGQRRSGSSQEWNEGKCDLWVWVLAVTLPPPAGSRGPLPSPLGDKRLSCKTR